MHYYTLGNRQNKSLVILHGWGLNGEKYRELAGLLAEHFYVVVSDFPGFGKTEDPVRPYGVQDYMDHLIDFLCDQGIREAIFFGHSFGGRVTIALSSRHPEMVRAIILSGAPGVEAFDLMSSLKRFVSYILAKLLKPFAFIPFVERLRDKYYEQRDFGKVKGIMIPTFLKVIREPLAQDAKRIQKKALLLWGERDTISTVHDAKKLQQCIAGSSLRIFPGVGHGLPYQVPREVAKEIKRFLKTCDH